MFLHLENVELVPRECLHIVRYVHVVHTCVQMGRQLVVLSAVGAASYRTVLQTGVERLNCLYH